MAPAGCVKINDTLWEIPKSHKQGMRTPARIYASKRLLDSMDASVFEQVTNVATLPGIVGYSFCMPDGHSGYGFPIGGVAAFDTDAGVISPGGIGFDINCGMRLVATSLTWEEVQPQLPHLVDRLFARIPAGVGGKGFLKLSPSEFRTLSEKGMKWCLKKGYAIQEDLDRTEENGCIREADASKVSEKAVERGYKQIGTLGSGNHYLEIQVAQPENIFDQKLAAAYGIDRPNQVVVMFHCGSRGFGHQIATDYLQAFLKVMQPKFGIPVRDRELACAPFASQEGQDYFKAMNCAINMSFVNRQVILHRIREVFSEIFGKDPMELGLRQIYDVTHNTAKVERHRYEGKQRDLLVHRKGATRAFAPGMRGIPEEYRDLGQPVIIGGSMETGSYLLAGVAGGEQSFFTTAHGSGRTMGRNQAKKQFRGQDLEKRLRERGIYIRAASYSGLAEEAGAAYKDIDEVVQTTAAAGLSRPVVKLVPVGNVKG
ncbi:MAG: RtcB family protein [Spirochaetaceae bacterium]|nr:MAG: RtcB family protein [Spirochaetaceae bacterium]